MKWARDNVKPVAIAGRNEYHRDDVGQNARMIIEAMKLEAARLEATAQAKAGPAIVAEAARNTQKWTANVLAQTQVDLGALLRDDDLVDFLSVKSEEFNSLITSLSTDVMQNIERQTLGSIFEGRSNADIAKSLTQVASLGRSRARLIARDQAGKLNGSLNMFRQQQAGINSYRWLGIDDGRERRAHIARNNRIFPWDRPELTPDGQPGIPINCRCRALAVIPDDETGDPSAPEQQEINPEVDFGSVAPLIQRVALTPKKNVFVWQPEEITARLADLGKAQEAITALKSQRTFAGTDVDKLAEAVFGYVPNDDALADLVGGGLRSIFTTRRTMIFQAVSDWFEMIGRFLAQAKVAAKNGPQS